MEGSKALGIVMGEDRSAQGRGSHCVPGTGQREPGREFTCPVLSDESHLKVRLGQAVHGGPTETALSLSLVADDKGLL